MTSHQSSQSYKYSIAGKRAKDALNKDEQELYELCCLAGIEMSPAVYRIIMNLLKMNVSPIAITQMLKSMVNPKGSVMDPTPTALLTSRSSASSSDIPGTGTGTYPGHSLVKRSASHSAVSGGSSTSRSSKGGSRSATSLHQSDSSGRSRLTKTSSNTRT